MLQIKTKISKFKAECICSRCQSIYECNFYDAKKSRIGDLCDTCKDTILNMKNFTQSGLLSVFNYNEQTGEITHNLNTRRCIRGALATHKHTEGYLQLTIGGKDYLAHRVIWFMKTGIWPDQIDHQDHDRSNNIWTNLSDVIHRKNQMNMSLKSNNSSGVNGVRILPSKRYCAFIMVQGKQISLGTYDTLDEAKSARQSADIKYGFHSNHGS